MRFLAARCNTRRLNPTGKWFIALACSLLAMSAAGNDEADLVLTLTSGRELRGQFDAASNERQLVLKSGNGSVTLRRSIDWQRIQRVTANGQAIAKADLIFQSRRLNALSNTELQPLAPIKLPPPPLRSIVLHGPPSATPLPDEVVSQPPPLVTSVYMDPRIANWDNDVEIDGLVVDVAPLDAYQGLVYVAATVEVELFAPQRRRFDEAPLSGGDTLELVERWTRAISPADFGPSGARLQLPFGAIQPELMPDWTAWWYGLVHVRLVVPGHGVFEDSRDGVRIRPWAPNRDRLEMQTNQRFLPTESLGRRN